MRPFCAFESFKQDKLKKMWQVLVSDSTKLKDFNAFPKDCYHPMLKTLNTLRNTTISEKCSRILYRDHRQINDNITCQQQLKQNIIIQLKLCTSSIPGFLLKPEWLKSFIHYHHIISFFLIGARNYEKFSVCVARFMVYIHHFENIFNWL